jgi:hypothetical protein
MTRKSISILDRFWKFVDRKNPDDCWIWSGGKNNKGYGRISNKEGSTLAHRVSFELFNSDIPNKLEVLHTCDNPPCVNPNHLYLGTHLENMMDMASKNRSARNNSHGTHTHPESICKGERNGRSKLIKTQAENIRIQFSNGLSVKSLSINFNVSKRTISRIISGESWK